MLQFGRGFVQHFGHALDQRLKRGVGAHDETGMVVDQHAAHAELEPLRQLILSPLGQLARIVFGAQVVEQCQPKRLGARPRQVQSRQAKPALAPAGVQQAALQVDCRCGSRAGPHLLSILAAEGAVFSGFQVDRVTAGQVLVRLDREAWEARLRQAEVEQRESARDLARVGDLQKTGAVSQSDRDAPAARRERAAAALAENCWLPADRVTGDLTHNVLRGLIYVGVTPPTATEMMALDSDARIAGLGRVIMGMLVLFVAGALLTGLSFFVMSWAGQRVLRDLVGEGTQTIRVDSREQFEALKAFGAEFMPAAAAKLQHYKGERPIFDLFSIDEEIAKALGRRVDLKSGGYLIVDQTEAFTTVDVNLSLIHISEPTRPY